MIIEDPFHRAIPSRPRYDIAMNCIATPRDGKWRCRNVNGIEVYRSVMLGPGGHKSYVCVVVIFDFVVVIRGSNFLVWSQF